MKTILVTGAAGGMGSAICRRLVAEGCRVFAVDLRRSENPEVESFCCDIRDVQALEQAKEAFCRFSDRLDGIVHAAGVYDLDALSELEDDRMRRIFEINVYGAFRINRLFAPLMEQGGRITIITSELAPLNPLPFTGIYEITKAALDKYAYSLRAELALRGISVSVVRPGAVKTGLLGDSASALDRFCSHTKYFSVNARNFKKIVDRVEARTVSPDRIADLCWHAQSAPHPRYLYNINRNFLLLLMSALPDHLQIWILKQILK